MTLRRLAAVATTTAVVTASLTLGAATPASADLLVVEAAAPTYAIDGPDAMGFGAQPLPVEITVADLQPGADAELELTVRDAPPAYVVLEQLTAPDTWAPLPLTAVERTEGGDDLVDSVAVLPVVNGATTLRFGFRLDESVVEVSTDYSTFGGAGGLDRAAESLRGARGGDVDVDASLSALAAAAPEEFFEQEIDSVLTVDGAAVGDPVTTSIPVLSPSLTLAKALPDTVRAGSSFTLSMTVDNATGSDYTDGPADYDSSLSAALGASFLDEDYLQNGPSPDAESFFPALDPQQVTVSCAAAGSALSPVVPVASEILGLFVPSLLVGRSELADGEAARYDCEITLAADLPDGELVLIPSALVGAVGYPVAGLPETDEFTSMRVLAAAAVPAPTTTQPPAAAPVPVDTLPETGATSPALAAYGALLLATGSAVVLASRRRRHA